MDETLPKRERLHSQKLTDQLFGGNGSHSVAAFPLRMVWMEKERAAGESPVQMMVSVSKRNFKHAVKRNRVKRQVRECYRLGKHALFDKLEQSPQRAVMVAFIWLANELYSTAEVDKRIKRLLNILTERL